MSDQPVLVARGLTRRYPSGTDVITPIDNYSLTLHAGEIVAVVGPSGSGKTTLLNLLGGWELPDAGSIEWRGAPGDPADLDWSEVATVPQVPGLLDELSVRENIALPLLVGAGASWQEATRGPRVSGLLDQLGLSQLAERHPSATSLGEQQRCSIARALVHAPGLLLADEPTAHQDARMLRIVVDALAGAAEGGTCCVVATHNVEVLDRATRVIDLGRAQVP
jgi:ABC-type lipoprotein export system ATPase subunit